MTATLIDAMDTLQANSAASPARGGVVSAVNRGSLFLVLGKYGARDDQTLDLLGALIDLGDLRVAVEFFHRVFRSRQTPVAQRRWFFGLTKWRLAKRNKLPGE